MLKYYKKKFEIRIPQFYLSELRGYILRSQMRRGLISFELIFFLLNSILLQYSIHTIYQCRVW